MGIAMASSRPNEKTLKEAFAIIEDTPDMEVVVGKLRELLNIDHVVYYLPKVGAANRIPKIEIGGARLRLARGKRRREWLTRSGFDFR